MTHGALTVSVAIYSVVNVRGLSMQGTSSAPELVTTLAIFSYIAPGVNVYALSIGHVCMQYFLRHTSSSVSDCMPCVHACRLNACIRATADPAKRPRRGTDG